MSALDSQGILLCGMKAGGNPLESLLLDGFAPHGVIPKPSETKTFTQYPQAAAPVNQCLPRCPLQFAADATYTAVCSSTGSKFTVHKQATSLISVEHARAVAMGQARTAAEAALSCSRFCSTQTLTGGCGNTVTVRGCSNESAVAASELAGNTAADVAHYLCLYGRLPTLPPGATLLSHSP